MNIKIKSDDLKRVRDNVKKDLDVYKKDLKLLMYRALDLLHAAIIIEIQKKLKRRSGLLMNSIGNSKEVREEGAILVASIGPVGVVYAAIHEFGGTTRPHIIRPKYKKVLRWVASEGQYTDLRTRKLRTNKLYAFASKVNHPGSKIPARPYLRPAFIKMAPKIQEKFGLHLSTSFKWEA